MMRVAVLSGRIPKVILFAILGGPHQALHQETVHASACTGSDGCHVPPHPEAHPSRHWRADPPDPPSGCRANQRAGM